MNYISRMGAFVIVAFALLAFATPDFAQVNLQPTVQSIDQFRKSLTGSVSTAMGGNDKFSSDSINWVLLLDTSQYKSTAPFEAASDQVLESLFGSTIRRGDNVSVIPFQITPEASTLWNQPVNTFDALRAKLPGPETNTAHNGGRDIEAAVKAALGRLQQDGLAGKSVVLILSSSENSEVPIGEPNYRLTTAKDSGLEDMIQAENMAHSISVVSVGSQQIGGNKLIPVYVQSYIPSPLAGIGKLANGPIIIPPPPKHEVVPWYVYVSRVVAILVVIVVICFLLVRKRSVAIPTNPPLLVLEHTNRRFPPSGLIELYGPGQPLVEGSDILPTKLSFDDPSLPPAPHGKLLTLDVRNSGQVAITSFLYKSTPDTIEFNKDSSVTIEPTKGVDGPTLLQKIKVQR